MRTQAPLLAILAVAAVVRYWAIDFCLPSPFCRPDEEAVANLAIQFFTRDLNPRFFDWPTLFMYETAAGLVGFFKAGLFLGWYRGEYHFLQTLSTDASPAYLIARLLSATAGVASIWVLARVGRRLFGDATALVGAFFLALAFLHVRDSHFGVTDVTGTTLALVSFLFSVRFSESGRRRDLILAAVMAGLATSTKYNMAIVALPAFWVVFTSGNGGEGEGARPAWLGRIALFAGVMVLAFALTSPYSFLDYARFVEALRGVSDHLVTGHGVMLGRGWMVHLTSSLRYGLGLPLLAAGLTGLVLLLYRRPRQGVVVGLFPVAYYLVIGGGFTVFARYILPVVPFLCLTAAFAVSEAGRSLATWSRRPNWAPAAAWALALVVIAPSAWSAVQFDRLLAKTDSRVLAAEWIELRFPEGVSIAEVGRSSTKLFFPPEGPSTQSRYRMSAFTDATAASNPDILIVPTSLFDPRAEVPAGAAALAARYTPVHRVEAHDLSSKSAVYDWQDEFYLPLAGFAGISRPGPNLTIYVRPDLASAVAR